MYLSCNLCVACLAYCFRIWPVAHLGVRVGVGWLVAVHAGRVSSLHSLPCGLWCAETRGPVARSPIAWWPQSGHILSFVAWVVALTFCLSCLRLQLGHALLSPTAPPLPISTSASMAHVLARQFCRLQSSGAANLPHGSLPTPNRVGSMPWYRVCAVGSGLACSPRPSAGRMHGSALQPRDTRKWLASSCGSRWPLVI